MIEVNNANDTKKKQRFVYFENDVSNSIWNEMCVINNNNNYNKKKTITTHAYTRYLNRKMYKKYVWAIH